MMSGAARRFDWRETVRVAADVALLGIVTTAAALPVVTAGAAVATASAALHHHLEYDRWPGPAQLWRMFRRGLLPGLAATAVLALFAVLLAADLAALRRGIVPGGAVLIGLTALAAAAGAGYAALVVVAVGAHDGRGWVAALRDTRRTVTGRPAALVAAAGVVTLAGLLLALVHPASTPVLFGYVLFAVHAVSRHLAGRHRAGRQPAGRQPAGRQPAGAATGIDAEPGEPVHP